MLSDDDDDGGGGKGGGKSKEVGKDKEAKHGRRKVDFGPAGQSPQREVRRLSPLSPPPFAWQGLAKAWSASLRAVSLCLTSLVRFIIGADVLCLMLYILLACGGLCGWLYGRLR